MSTIAYELRSEYLEGFLGGLLAVDANRDFDVKAHLDAGPIVIDESDTALVLVLDNYPALKRTASGDAAPTVNRYDGLTVAELRADAANRGLATGGSKADLSDRLTNADGFGVAPADAAQDADLGVAGTPDPAQTTTATPEA